MVFQKVRGVWLVWRSKIAKSDRRPRRACFIWHRFTSLGSKQKKVLELRFVLLVKKIQLMAVWKSFWNWVNCEPKSLKIEPGEGRIWNGVESITCIQKLEG